MILSKQTLQHFQRNDNLPTAAYFQLPEKILQFGTGILLRGLPDYFVDKANKQNIFNGRIVVVKSTAQGDIDAFKNQDGLYTLCVKGIENGKTIDSTNIIASISRVLTANMEWENILQCATNDKLEIIISNTTEVGLTLIDNDNIFAKPPTSFPGKLLAFLYERFMFFDGTDKSGLIIIPTELIVGNADKLKSILITLSHQNKLSNQFIEWLNDHNQFCNSLVDRIVPGKLKPDEKKSIEEKLGYEDELMIMAEPYRLWAIESAADTVQKKLSFALGDAGVIIAPDITKFRELKLRLLNGTHTLNCGLATLAGFQTVKQAMQNTDFKKFTAHLMLDEIAPSIINDQITADDALQFGNQVIERFSNPFIEHLWLSITLQFTSKMLMRNIPILQKHYQRSNDVPPCIALGFAGYILFMKSKLNNDNQFVGSTGNSTYIINDDKAAVLNKKWNEKNIPETVMNILGDKDLWNADLTKYPGFAEKVSDNVDLLINTGAEKTIKDLVRNYPATLQHE